MSLSALTPATTSLQSGQQVQFAVSVSGTSNTALSWSIVDATGASHASGDTTVGTISDAGLYTAPVVTSAMTLTLLVGATADTSVQRSATVTVMPVPPPVAITISPTAGSAQACAQSPCPSISTVNFAATVANATDPSVTWKVNGIVLGDATVGHISTGGTYTAPTTVPNPATVTVTAVSNQDPTKSAGATVTITAIPPPIVVTLNQTSVTLLTGQSFAFTATDSQGNPLPVTFTLTCSASDCGSLPNPGTATATYIAPSNLPGNATLNVSVVVTSVADPTKSATAAVTINPIAPSLTISFNDVVVHSSAGTSSAGVLTPNSLQLTAVVNNLPSNSPTPVIDWTQGSDFCISTDEETQVDNCGDDDGEQDGPGTVTPTSNNVAIYQAPVAVFDANTPPPDTGAFVQNKCAQATSAAQPYVYVTASTSVNNVTLVGSACIRVSP